MVLPLITNSAYADSVPCARLTKDQFVAWLKQRRETETLAEVAVSLGVSVMTVTRWINGSRQPSRMTLSFATHIWIAGK